ncbi:hypothetical protein C900_02625 [Fulvivirga imtechensis AK7]|uniref:PKD domain-containing protein n=1 Tax=Fulvivirga imtechensis AK7 TaxID=1237149 RepID=L8JXM7_9BACT|nr:S8 family serine peptidase [Fulvivirga imtechensis]ELR73540.1 hypothetical protein C900_02625 [Fulvivirga imtechensis AK7]
MKQYLLLLISLLLTSTAFAQQRKYTLPEHMPAGSYDPQVIVVRIKPSASSNAKGGSSLKSSSFLNKINASNIEAALPYIEKLPSNARSAGVHPLTNIYKITLHQGEDVINSINELLQYEEVVYAEPYFNHRPLYVPNDPESDATAGMQTYLGIISAYDAWDIEKGDSTIVIGILDTGVELDHEDLKGNIFYNVNDPINGVDDDNDGLVDNYSGWDIANGDNIPEADTDSHGTRVAGISSASTNNGTGIAGVGFRSKFLPIKVFASGSNMFSRGYEAIALAADLGCKVINLSWGSIGSYSDFGQEVINYAVLEKNAVVVAAAGNTDMPLDFYPASFDNVLSVGATALNDQKASWATYSYHIDLMAPGTGVYTTDNSNSYLFNGAGTSFSAPMVSGTAALLWARYPHLTAQQIMEKIRVTADEIYHLPGNASFPGQLGKGRLNMLKALTDETSPAVRVENVSYTNGVGEYAFYGDTLSITMDFKNYLAPTSPSATATISSTSPYVTIIDSVVNIGAIGTLAKTSNTSVPLKVLLADDLHTDETLRFRVDFKDGAYDDFQHFTIMSSPRYITIEDESLAMTVSSNGNLGYNLDGSVEGVGITWKGTKVLDGIGLINATSSSTVADNAPISNSVHTRDKNYQASQNVKFYTNSEADIDIRNTFFDHTGIIGINIEQKTLTWKRPDNSNAIVLEYRIINSGSDSIKNLKTAVFANWNLNNKDYNKAGWDDSYKLGYVKDTETDTLYTGLALLTDQDPIYFAIDNRNFNGNNADIPPVMDDAVKYNLVSQGVAQTSAGDANNGNDVSHVLGANVNALAVNQSQKVAIAVVAGNTLSELQAAVASAQSKYLAYLNTPPLLYTAYTCPGTNASIDPPQGDIYEFYSDLALTNLLTTGTSYITPSVNTTQTYYVVNKDNAYDGDVYRVQAAPNPVMASFSMNPDPLLINEDRKTLVTFTDESAGAVSWQWDFDNGFTATVQNPIMNFTKSGSYNVELTATNTMGCTETITKVLVVACQSTKPDLSDQNICKGESVTLDPDNATNLKVYTDPALANEIFSGTSFVTGAIKNDTTFYVISTDSTYASDPKTVAIFVSDLKANFMYSPDTTDLNSKTLLQFTNTSENYQLYYWYIDNQLKTVNTDFEFDYSDKDQFEVTLIAENATGCFDTLKQVITPAISGAPSSSNIEVCSLNKINIKPDNGLYFYFYSDAALQNLQYKGRSITLENVTNDTSIFVTNADLLLESAPAEIKVNVSDILATFTLTPSSIDLSKINSLKILNESKSASEYIWLINGDTLSTEFVPDLFINQTGSYEIQLIAKNETGCMDVSVKTLEVVPVTGLSQNSGVEIQIYPNPARDKLHLINFNDATTIDLLDGHGRHITTLTATNDYIDIRHIPSGTYTLKFSHKGTVYFKKLIKQAD